MYLLIYCSTLLSNHHHPSFVYVRCFGPNSWMLTATNTHTHTRTATEWKRDGEMAECGERNEAEAEGSSSSIPIRIPVVRVRIVSRFGFSCWQGNHCHAGDSVSLFRTHAAATQSQSQSHSLGLSFVFFCCWWWWWRRFHLMAIVMSFGLDC